MFCRRPRAVALTAYRLSEANKISVISGVAGWRAAAKRTSSEGSEANRASMCGGVDWLSAR